MPAKGGERAYALLREAIRETGLVGIATIVLRDAQHLAALEVVGDAMVLTLMRYAEELVDIREYHFPPRKTSASPSCRWRGRSSRTSPTSGTPSQYTDEYRENLMKIIKAKLKGKEAAPGRARRAAERRSRRPDGAPAAIARGSRRRRGGQEEDGSRAKDDRSRTQAGARCVDDPHMRSSADGPNRVVRARSSARCCSASPTTRVSSATSGVSRRGSPTRSSVSSGSSCTR